MHANQNFLLILIVIIARRFTISVDVTWRPHRRRRKATRAVTPPREGSPLHAGRNTPMLEVMGALQESTTMDWTDCPLVEINPRKLSGVPILKGTRMPADGIVENYRDGLPADEIAEVFELPAESVRELLAYAVARNPTLKP